MKHGKLLLIAVVFALFIVPSGAFAQTVELSATLSGTQTCADFDTIKLKQTLFVSFDGSFFDVFLDSGFSNLYVSLEIFQVYQIGHTLTSDTYTVGAFSNSPHAALFEGTVKITSKSFTAVGAFIDYDESNDCMSYGTLKSGKIIAVLP
jgi:asparagine N-glycosylation enzyme membrane subunit Stt3